MLAVAVAALVPAVGGGAQPAQGRPTSSAAPDRPASRPTSQAAACTALIDSGRFTRQNLAILHSNRGIAYGKAGDYDRAIADFDAAMRINPNHVRAYLNRGNANFARRDYDRAIADFSQAIRLEPKNVTIVMSRATAYEAKGDFGRAIADYDQALKLDPKLTAAITNRGARLAPQRQPRPRHRRLRPGHQAQPEGRRRLQQPRHRLADKRDFDRAAADYEQALKLDPNFALDLSQPRPALARQEGLRPRHRRFRPGDPARARQRGGDQRPRR